MKDYFTEKMGQLINQNLYRFLKTVSNEQGATVIYKGKEYLNFSSNNYLGLANHPQLKQAAITAIKKYGVGSGASRLITGSMSLHEELEKKIATFKGTKAALVFNSGYQANTGIISSLMQKGDVIFSDSLNHASLIDGCRLSKADVKIYQHHDMGELEALLHRSVKNTKRLIITDTLFSMDGDLCNLPQIIKLAEKFDAWVMIDEAHTTGVFGKTGRGVVEHDGIDPKHPHLIQMGTLGKALGSFGAYVCGPKVLIEYLINKARSFIYTTALPPSVLAASIAAIDLISNDSSYRDQLWENVKYFTTHHKNRLLGGQAPTSPIIPIIIGDNQKTIEFSNKLFKKGIWAQAIRPPTVPKGTARIRLTLMASHTKEHLDRCLNTLEQESSRKTSASG